MRSCRTCNEGDIASARWNRDLPLSIWSQNSPRNLASFKSRTIVEGDDACEGNAMAAHGFQKLRLRFTAISTINGTIAWSIPLSANYWTLVKTADYGSMHWYGGRPSPANLNKDTVEKARLHIPFLPILPTAQRSAILERASSASAQASSYSPVLAKPLWIVVDVRCFVDSTD
jgi:hypothetical protein